MNDLPAVYHDHDGPTIHSHKGMGPGHYMEPSGHLHLTQPSPNVLVSNQTTPTPQCPKPEAGIGGRFQEGEENIGERG